MASPAISDAYVGQNSHLYLGRGGSGLTSKLIALDEARGETTLSNEPNLEDIPQSDASAMERALIMNAVNWELGTLRLTDESEKLRGDNDDLWGVMDMRPNKATDTALLWALKVNGVSNSLDFGSFPGIIMQNTSLIQRSYPFFSRASKIVKWTQAAAADITLSAKKADTRQCGLLVVTKFAGTGVQVRLIEGAHEAKVVTIDGPGIYELPVDTLDNAVLKLHLEASTNLVMDGIVVFADHDKSDTS